MGQDNAKPESDDSKNNADQPKTAKDQASGLLSSEAWDAKSKADSAPKASSDNLNTAGADANSKSAVAAADISARIEQSKPFSQKQKDDLVLRETLDKMISLNDKKGDSAGGLSRFADFADKINLMISDKNSVGGAQLAPLDKDRLTRVLSVVEKYQLNLDALNEAQKKSDTPTLERLLKDQTELKKQMETAAFRQDMTGATRDLSTGFNVLHQVMAGQYNEALSGLVQLGRKVPLEQLPQDLPAGLKGLAMSDDQLRSLISQGQLKLPERSLAANELPTGNDLIGMNKLLRFTDAAQQEVYRGKLEGQYALAQSKLGQIDASGELGKKWFPEKVEKLSNEQIEKRLAAATPWIQKGLEVQRYAELNHRLGKMIDEQFNWPSFLGGIPSKWDDSALKANPNVVTLDRDDKTQKINIKVTMPETLDRNDSNTEQMRQMDAWLAKYKGPVDQVLGQIDKSKAENSVVYWGDIKSEMRVDKDGNMVESGFKDAQGNQVFQDSDGRNFRDAGKGKEYLPADEKLTAADYRILNGKTDWVKPGEEVKDVNLMEFRTDAKAVKGANGEPLIEISQIQTLQYAHFASYQGMGWVSDVKTMGGAITASKLDKDTSIPLDKGVAGGRRDGKIGDYLVTLADGRQQFIDQKSFETLYRPNSKEGAKPGEFEEKPRVYKPDDWLIVYKTDSGQPQPTLMQAKDVPSFVSSQAKWHYGGKVVTGAVDALMLLGGVAEVRAAMIGVTATAEAAAGTAARATTMQVLGKALLTRQGMTGLLHAGFGATGFMGQGIENIGPSGKTFMQARAFLMMADLSYTAIGRPLDVKPFVPTAAQIAQQGFLSSSLLKFSQVFSGATTLGRAQSLGADLYFMSDIGFRQIPGIINHAKGTDSQQSQQQAALGRQWVQADLPEDRKVPSSFDKQTAMQVEAFKQPTDAALKEPENAPARIAFNKKLIQTIQNDQADARDKFGAALALVTLNSREGKLPDKIVADGASLSRGALQKFVDDQRYLQAQAVLDGYEQGMKIHVAPELQGKLDALETRAKSAMSDNANERSSAMGDLIATFNSTVASPEEKLLSASAMLFARRRSSDGQLSETIVVGQSQVKAKELVDFLYASSQPKQGTDSSVTENPGHIRLFAGDMLLRLDVNRFSLEDMNQICLSIVNDKRTPVDPAAKERWNQLKLQAMTDAHGYRLGDLYEIMKSRVEPTISNMPVDSQKAIEAKGLALASLQGRDSYALRASLETLRNNDDPRIAGLAAYTINSADSTNQSDRANGLAQLHAPGAQLAWPDNFNKEAQNRWVQDTNLAVLAKLNADLPGQSGTAYDHASDDKFRAAQELISKYPDLKNNPEIQSQINSGLMALVTADNPALAAKALPVLLSRIKTYEEIFKQSKPEQLTAPLKDLRDKLFGDGAILSTLRDNSLDMLNDSSSYSTYTARAANLGADLQKMNADYQLGKDKLSETDRVALETKISELAAAYQNASTAPLSLKSAVLEAMPAMLRLASENPLGAGDPGANAVLKAIQGLIHVQSEKPETASADLRTQAIQSLAKLGDRSSELTTQLAGVLADDPSPQVRLAALDALKKLAPDDLQRICLKQLSQELHPEVAKRLREIEFSNRRPGPDSSEYRAKFEQAKIDLITQSSRSLTGVVDYIKSSPDLKFLDGQTLRNQAAADLRDDYFNGIGGFFRFAWDGEKGVDADHAKLLDKYAGSMRDSMDTLGKKAASDDDALKALVYIALSNGRPALKDDRQWAGDKATEKLKEICQTASPERAKQIAWAVQTLMLNQPGMSAVGRQNMLDGLKSLVSKSGQSGMSNDQVATTLAATLERELRKTPAPAASDFTAHEKLQLDLLNSLSDSRFRTKETLPVLQALEDKSSIASVKLKAGDLATLMSERSDLIRQAAQLPSGADSTKVAGLIADQLGNPLASSEKVGQAIALSEKLGAIQNDSDPRRSPLQIASRDGSELVRMMAARELSKSSNADDRKLAYSVLSVLEKQGSRPGYVTESRELLSQILANPKLSAEEKTNLTNIRNSVERLDPASYRNKSDRSADISASVDYQDSYERATIDLKENSLRNRDLAKYQGADNWFSKNTSFNLLDDSKLREARKQARLDAFPGFVPWIFTSSSTIDKNCDNAEKDVFNKQDQQLKALGDQAKQGESGAEAREALASIVLSQGQPFSERDRPWAMHQAAQMIRDCIKEGQPGSRDMIWAVKAALIEGPSLDPTTRWYLMSAVENAQRRSIIDTKEASIVMAAALQSEFSGMPAKAKDPAGYKASIANQDYAISMIGIWGNVEAVPVLEAMANYHSDATLRQHAKAVYTLLSQKLFKARPDAPAAQPNQRSDASSPGDSGSLPSGAKLAMGTNSQDKLESPKPLDKSDLSGLEVKTDADRQLVLNQLQDQILDFERIRLRLPQGTSADQIERALQAEGSQNT